MKNLISSKHKHLLYKDEIGDQFLITHYMEIFRKSKSTLGCYCWSPKNYFKLKARGIIFNDLLTGDGLYVFDTNIENLEILVKCGAPKKRIYRSGKNLKSREKRLGHRIIPFNPKLD